MCILEKTYVVNKTLAERKEGNELTHIWDGGNGRGCVGLRSRTPAQKIYKKTRETLLNHLQSTGKYV